MTKIEKQVLLLLAMAQFILTLDSTVMNVSISTLVTDLNTTVAGVQSAITFYTLVMAAFMVAGAKIGDIIGRKRAFVIGLVIYGIGSLITALSQNLTTLLFGWSLLEGIGAALVIPAMLSLIASNYPKGPKRIQAYASVAAIAAIGAAVGPIVGGVLTTYATWRLAFFGEVLVVIYILFRRSSLKDAPVIQKAKGLDIMGVILSAGGLALVVYGVLQAGVYGLVRARQDVVIGGRTVIHEGGISPTVILVVAGLIVLAGFALWERRSAKRGKPVLLNLALLKKKVIQSGVGTIFFQLLLLGGVMYGTALFLQIELGYNAMKTGLSLLPLSIMILVLASRGSIMASKYSSRTIVRAGFTAMLLGALWVGIRARTQTSGLSLAPSLALLGAGMGMVASQLQNAVQNAVSESESAETSGLMATFQYLGQSFGTAISGVLIITSILVVSNKVITQNTTLSSDQKLQLTAAYQENAQLATDQQVQIAVATQPADVQEAVVSINAEVRKDSLSNMFILLAVISVLGLLTTKHLPAQKQKV